MNKKTPADFRGKAVSGDLRFDGVLYQHKTVWNCDEDADAFLEAVGAVKQDRTFIDGRLTMWWS